MSGGIAVALLVTSITAATPLILAAIGETVAECAGVLNLGVEGMMLAGAVCAFITTTETGSGIAGFFASMAAGMVLAALFGVLTLALAANQVASGLALTIFGTGLSGLLGTHFVGRSVPPLPKLDLPSLSVGTIIGRLFLHYDALVYFAVAMTAITSIVLSRTRFGLALRAVGENDSAAHALGHDVIRVRALAVLFGGAMAGSAGGYLSLAATPMWMEGLSAGRGWIALALVVFGAWRPWRVFAGGILFGAISALQLYLQGAGLVAVPAQVFAMVPYLGTILVLTFVAGNAARRFGAPACLGNPFVHLR